jgi:ParB family transcriptional regulator, chromosome partitioning protein
MKDKRSVGDAIFDDLDVAMRAGTLASAAPAARTMATPTKLGREMLEGAGQTIARQKERIGQLEAERGAGMVLLRLDPKSIVRTGFANRHELGLGPDDEGFQRLKQSIESYGQDTPVRVRPAAAGSAIPYELVEGHRRLAVCLELDRERPAGFPILARLDGSSTSSADLVLKMYRENAEREDLSPYEYGRMFASWLEAGVFPSQIELAKAVGLSEGTISKYLHVRDLPASVLAAFGDPRRIALRWVPELERALKSGREFVLAAAERIGAQRPVPTPDSVLRELISAASGPDRRASPTREEAVKVQGKVAFRIARRDGRITLKFGKLVDRAVQRELAEEVKDVAERWLAKRLKAKSP